ncbi:hypothetical protein GQR58_010303 [Nymphon striatum]|nr:hypothetical protein GQR58_010303 [Nymphon striatum]
MSEYRLRWLGQVQRMDVCNPVKDAWIRDVSGQRPRGKPRLRWRDVVTKDMNERGLCINDVYDKVLWRAGIRSPDPIPLNSLFHLSGEIIFPSLLKFHASIITLSAGNLLGPDCYSKNLSPISFNFSQICLAFET